MPRERNDLIDRLQYYALRVVSMAMHSWPVELNLAAARLVGQGLWRVDRKHRERALANLQRSMPELSPARRQAVAQQSMQHLVMLGVEVLFTTRLIRLESWARHVVLEDMQNVMKLLLDRHRGLIMLTGHYGNWEILGYVLAALGFSTTSVARPLDNPYINEWLLGVRQRMGQKIIDKKGATDDVTRILHERGAVAFIADQNAGTKGLFVDFFGRKASTYKSIGLLAMEYKVPVVIGYARRVAGQFRFEVGTSDIIYPEDWQDHPDPLRYITQRYTTAIETFVRQDPSQYLWVHRRWKTRPKGEQAETYD
jgi:Kdo2-lipid IVA lauroyltransferase/acyltransferase